jgi:hypothetical protein
MEKNVKQDFTLSIKPEASEQIAFRVVHKITCLFSLTG